MEPVIHYTIYIHPQCTLYTGHYNMLDNVTKVRTNQIWQGQDDAHSLIIIAQSMVLPYLIGSYFRYNTYYLNIHKTVYERRTFDCVI